MTVDELINGVKNKKIILCDNAKQRAQVIEFLQDLGFELSNETEDLIIRLNDEPIFLCPGMQEYGNLIVCWRTAFVRDLLDENPDRIIRFEDVPFASFEETFEETDEDFAFAFHELCGFSM